MQAGKEIAKIIIYYDLDEVRPADIELARRTAGSGAIEIIAQGTLWPESNESPPPQQQILSRTNSDFRDEAMVWFEALYRSLQAADFEWTGWQKHGIPLLEVVRYALLYGASLDLHRSWAMSEILNRWVSDHLIWITNLRRRGERKALKWLFEPASARGIQVHLLKGGSNKAFHQKLNDRAKDVIWPRYQHLRRVATILKGKTELPELNGRPRVVFTEYFPNSAKASIPVAEMLAKDSQVEVIWLAGRKTVRDELKKSGVKSWVVDEIGSELSQRRVNTRTSEIRSFDELLTTIPDSNYSWHTDGPPFRCYLSHVLSIQLLPLLNEAAYWVEAYFNGIKLLRPAALVSTTYSSIPGRAAALVARAMGSKAVYIQHGAFPDQFLNSFFCHDLKLMWGLYERASLLRFGHHPDSIEVTGSTIYDSISPKSEADRVCPFPKPGEPIRIAYLASRTGGAVVTTEVARQTLRLVAEAVGEITGGELIVKTHPGETTTIPEQVMSDYPAFRLERGKTSQEVIAESDVVIVVSSTTGLEACCMAKPLVVFNLTGMKGFVDYTSFSAAIEVTSVTDLRIALSSIQHDYNVRDSLAEGRKRLLDEMLNGGNGGAAERAAAAIGRLIGETFIGRQESIFNAETRLA
ncbi:MAG: CDP-glycerol:poly(glycerophosphate) glycerophosphotransferase [Acidobacteria bacterium]|nr:CDP-glycerol:poly(glycerophosphate) glycerophosphotransferase [Acidobacteriota bacterium]